MEKRISRKGAKPRRKPLRNLLAFFVFCLLLTASCLLPRVFSQNETLSPQAQPTPAASPSPSPTPPPNLHQWGAVTSFHGLPSDRTHAIAQTEFGVTWFATDGGLARYDGRRTNAINAEGLPQGRVLALKVDESGALWIGTDNGAARMWNGKFDPIKETAGKVITAIITPQRDRAIMASESGQIFDCQVKVEGPSPLALTDAERKQVVTFTVRSIPDQPLPSADKDHPGSLKITSLAMAGDKLYAGTQSRGVLSIENGEAKEIISKPRSYFINALETDAQGRLWVGVKTRAEDSGLFDETEPLKPNKANGATGPVMAIIRGPHDDVWIGTDGRGAFHFQNGKAIEHFTFEGTGGALRSDHVFGVFVDAEEVIWFATDKGVCRYDPHATRTENISDDPGTNYIRALWRTSRGRVLAGTNAGLYLHDESKKAWSSVPEIGRRIVYALGEDKAGRVLVATASGLFASVSATNALAFMRIPPPTEKLAQGDNVRAIANANGSTYVATFGYGVERLQGTQRSLVWPDAAADNQLRDVTALGVDASDRLVIGTATGAVFFFDGKQATTDNAFDKLKGGAVWSILADGSDIWLGADKGLYLFQANQLKEIVPGVNARSIVIVAGDSKARQVWCAT
ncbi:MAG TPA: two-component regulator propeller domain-containing protein, partial [Pyrinomonadaceae bacterium]|nr:two-component regulator propeller domain-containing protein [Pyrinomonadaceae bacterium]